MYSDDERDFEEEAANRRDMEREQNEEWAAEQAAGWPLDPLPNAGSAS